MQIKQILFKRKQTVSKLSVSLDTALVLLLITTVYIERKYVSFRLVVVLMETRVQIPMAKRKQRWNIRK